MTINIQGTDLSMPARKVLVELDNARTGVQYNNLLLRHSSATIQALSRRGLIRQPGNKIKYQKDEPVILSDFGTSIVNDYHDHYVGQYTLLAAILLAELVEDTKHHTNETWLRNLRTSANQE